MNPAWDECVVCISRWPQGQHKFASITSVGPDSLMGICAECSEDAVAMEAYRRSLEAAADHDEPAREGPYCIDPDLDTIDEAIESSPGGYSTHEGAEAWDRVRWFLERQGRVLDLALAMVDASNDVDVDQFEELRRLRDSLLAGPPSLRDEAVE